MTPAALDAAIPAGAALLLDTSAVLAYLSGEEAASAAAAALIDGFVASGRNAAVLSAITVTEVLVRPMRARSGAAVGLVEDFLLRFPNLGVHAVTIEVAHEAARIRATTATRTPDAVILATGVVAGLSVVVTVDDSWRAIAKRAKLDPRVVVLN